MFFFLNELDIIIITSRVTNYSNLFSNNNESTIIIYIIQYMLLSQLWKKLILLSNSSYSTSEARITDKESNRI